MAISRRGLLVGAAVGGGLLVAWTLRERSFPTPLTPGRGEYVVDAWLRIGRDGVITVAVPQLEMGQGVTTILPQVVAMEMGADWRQIAVEPAPVSGAYANVPLAARWAPLWMPVAPGLADEPDDLIARRFAQDSRFAVTADGTSLAAYEMPCRHAAASARAMLAMAAADRWDVAWEECEAAGGFVFHGEKRLSFAELAEEAAGYEAPDPPVLRPELPAEIPGPGETGTDFPRLDLPAKVDGTFLFAGDVRLPGMAYAAIRHGPIDEAVLIRFYPERAQGVRELVGVVRGKRWLAAVANSWWSAEKALDRMKPIFSLSRPIESADIEQKLDDAVRSAPATRIALRGEGDAPMGGKPDLALRYDVAPAVHATLETASATARIAEGRIELWLASQAPEKAREAVAAALGYALSDVVLYPMPAGGSFDRRLEHDHAIEVALIAREIGRPVQLVWSRWQEQLAGRPRTPVAALLTAKLAEEGGIITALKTRIAAPATAKEFGHRLFDNNTSWAAVSECAGEADPMAVEGAMPLYDIPNVAIDHVPVTIGLPTGRMRGNAHGYTAFFTECFIDELAVRNEREPLSYRIEMLGQDLRMAECLQRAARLAEWGGGRDRSGQGLACHRMGSADEGGRIACIVTARQQEGGVRVSKISAAVDIGRIVNLDIARQQIEGGLIFGLSLALVSSTLYRSGLPTAGRLAELGLPLLADSPEIEVDFVASEEAPFDPGELGVAVAAPALANALFSATGLRLRRLPLLSEGL
jgi:isoquinoline 1-oxidoreductase beta subunit